VNKEHRMAIDNIATAEDFINCSELNMLIQMKNEKISQDQFHAYMERSNSVRAALHQLEDFIRTIYIQEESKC